MKFMFKRNNATKRRKLNMNEYKAMRIPDRICKNNKKLFVTVNTQNACKLGFSDRSWLPSLNQPQSDVVVFEIISFHILKKNCSRMKTWNI